MLVYAAYLRSGIFTDFFNKKFDLRIFQDAKVE